MDEIVHNGQSSDMSPRPMKCSRKKNPKEKYIKAEKRAKFLSGINRSKITPTASKFTKTRPIVVSI